MHPKYADIRTEVQKGVDTANGMLIKYINSSLAQGGIGPKLVRHANYKLFWGHRLTLVKNERGWLMDAAKARSLE